MKDGNIYHNCIFSSGKLIVRQKQYFVNLLSGISALSQLLCHVKNKLEEFCLLQTKKSDHKHRY